MPVIDRRSNWRSPEGLAVSASVVHSVASSRMTVGIDRAGLVIGTALDVRGRIVSHAGGTLAGDSEAGAFDCAIVSGVATLVAVDVGQSLSARYQAGALIRGASLFIPRDWLEREADADGAFRVLDSVRPAHGFRQAALGGSALRSVVELMDNPFVGRMAELHAESRCYDLLLHAIGCYADLSRPDRRVSHRSPSASTRQRMMRARDLLDARLDDPPSLQELASIAGSSVSVLRKSFAAVIGMPVAAYVRRGRLEAARRHLLQGATLPDAAAIAGYSSVANFCTGFRRAFDATPACARPAGPSPRGRR